MTLRETWDREVGEVMLVLLLSTLCVKGFSQLNLVLADDGLQWRLSQDVG